MSRRTRSRFNLSLLEEGEYFLDDYAASRMQVPSTSGPGLSRCLRRKVAGRLKVCTRCVLFEPNDTDAAVVKFKFRDMAAPAQVASEFSEDLRLLAAGGGDGTELGACFAFTCSTTTEMKAGNRIGPYAVKKADGSRRQPRDHMFSLSISSTGLPSVLLLLHKLATMDDAAMEAFVHARHVVRFDTSCLGVSERPLLPRAAIVHRVDQLVNNPGVMMLSNKAIYFQPAPVNNPDGASAISFPLAKIKRVYRRRYMLRQCGLEVYTSASDSVFFAFESTEELSHVYSQIMAQPVTSSCGAIDSEQGNAAVTAKWQRGEVGNFEYLVHLNSVADRTVNDLTQYPVMPWIVADYTSETLDLSARDAYSPTAAQSIMVNAVASAPDCSSSGSGTVNPSQRSRESFKKLYDDARGCSASLLCKTRSSTSSASLREKVNAN